MISVITPLYNARTTIERTFASVREQDCSIEHIVVDGGSTDGSLEIAEEYRKGGNVRLLYGPDNGLYDAVAKGFASSSGEILAYINGDDFYAPNALATVASVFDRNPSINWITGIPSWFIEEEGIAYSQGFVPVTIRSLIERGYYNQWQLGGIAQEATFWRRSLYEKAGGANVLRKFRLAGDFQLWRAFAVHSDLITVPAVFGYFTLSKNQLSTRHVGLYRAECGVPRRLLIPQWAYGGSQRLYSSLFYRKVLRFGYEKR